MTPSYLLPRLMPEYAAPEQIKLRLSLGDGLEDLPSCPVWY